MNKEEILSRLKELDELIPVTLEWDWKGTNHYELTNSEGDYWWLLPLEIPNNRDNYLPDLEEGQRLGWIIEYAVLNRKLREMDK